ncbi:MAG: PAS domain S-box protein [Bacteroidales bacterium]|nr:PAS domain S-box protein [Bacteroidales bacterium]MBN2758084.1 PAS domain S-box protein [Bacteroidales bacterium]
MNKSENKDYIIRNSINGLVLGVLIRIIFIINGLLNNSYRFSLYGVYQYYKDNPVNLLFDFSVIAAFTIIGYFVGRLYSDTKEKLLEELSQEKDKTKSVFRFTEELRKGNFVEDDVLGMNNELSKSLVNLRNELKQKEEEANFRKKEDDQRHWITEGIAKFGAILRETSNDLEALSYSVVSNLSQYLESQVVGIYVVNDSEPENLIIEQTGAFAYGRNKFSDKVFEWGEGLVGACILEKKTIFLDEVNESYVEITSGLGKSNPRSMLIVPLLVNEKVFGAVELASFKTFESFEIELVEKVAESIASTISSLKINMQTSQLLYDSRGTQEKMAMQEKEMLESMEKLKKTQIEAAKQSEQFISFTNSVNHTMIRAEYTIEGILLYANTKFLKKLGYSSNKEVEGQHISMFINEKDREWFEDIWARLNEGGKHFEGDMKHVSKQGTDVWTMATYVSVRDHEGNPEKILFLGIDTTDAKKQSLDYTGQIDALNRSTIKAEFSPGGKMLDFNDKFENALEYKRNELRDKTIFDFIDSSEINEFTIIWKNVVAGASFEGRLKMIAESGGEKWFHGTYSIVRDMYGDIAKIVYIGYEITNQIKFEEENKIQTQKLRAQEEKLQQSQEELTKKLREAREEMRAQFREIETVKLLNEKTMAGMLDAVVTINQDNIIQFFNKAAEDLWSIDGKKVINRHITELLPENEEYKDEDYMGRYFKYGDDTLLNTRTEVFIVDKFGDQISVLLTLSEAQIGKRYSLTAFIQKIEVELF